MPAFHAGVRVSSFSNFETCLLQITKWILLPAQYYDYRQILPRVANNRGLMPCPGMGAMPKAGVAALPARSSDAGTTYLNRL
jgi:hypothetical protein